MPFREASADRYIFDGSISQGLGLRVGCLLCANNFEVSCTSDGAQQVRDLTEGDVPVSPASLQSDAGGCGLNAVNGICKNEDTLALVREMIGAGDIQGVFIR